jgi:hypothetical protein
MRAQGLPITTIVLIIICIVVLAAILLFFFGGFGKPQATLSLTQTTSDCNSVCAQVTAAHPGTSTIAGTLLTNLKFCDTRTIGAITGGCSTFTSCNVTKADLNQCLASCSGTTASCLP